MHDAVAAWSGKAAGWTLNVEVLLLSARDGEVCYRRVCGVSPPTMTPHARALELSGLDDNDPAALCHSTSWRVSTPGSLVVTYVALPDPVSTGAALLRWEGIRAADDRVWPEPDELELENVAMHAVRHLAMLSEEDPTVRTVVPHARDLWRCIIRAARTAETSAEADPVEAQSA